MSYSLTHRRSNSQYSRINKMKPNYNYENLYQDEDEEIDYNNTPSYKRNSSYYKNNYQKQNQNNMIVGYNDFYNFMNCIQNGFKVELQQKQIINDDGTKEIVTSRTFLPIQQKQHQPRKIVDIRTEKRTERIKDFNVQRVLHSYETGLIFKDTHYYTTQEVFPFERLKTYERTVTYYDDGTVNYGDWRAID